MLQFFKNLLKGRNFSLIKSTITKEVTPEEVLLSKLLEMVHDENLNALFYNPVSKLLVINTYTADFNDLTSNLYNNNFRKQIIAINVHSYFHSSQVDIKSDLEKITKCLRTHKPNLLIQHDLDELVNTYEYLKKLEN